MHARCTQPPRYKQLLFYATKLAPLPAEDHVPANKVEGCVSQVGHGVLATAGRWAGVTEEAAGGVRSKNGGVELRL